MSTRESVTYREAINRALRDAMEADENVVLLGEDIAAAGGSFKITEGLFDIFGPDRVTDTPISETGFVGAAIGMALVGFRPVVEMMFSDFAAVAFDQIVNEAPKYFFMSAGQMNVPLVIRCTGGGGLRFGSQHSATTESWYLTTPGLKVVAPSTPQDAYGMMLSAISDPNPVVYLEHKKLLGNTGPLDTSEGPIPFGKARVLRAGEDVTLVASLAMVPVALEAAGGLASDGIEAEVIDMRSLLPFDPDTIVESVQRTSHLVTVEEQTVHGGWGSSVAAEVVERAFDYLDHPPVRIGTPSAPIAFSPVLEDASIPSAERVHEAVRTVLGK
ncbi:MAG: alpha-ketoacid dehydrogenase subunit beta [Chloroflexota bacterium]|nr:MAG: alpha-ketoacid dehydrogenase subunit beta [Chloroflexota bacterium]